MNKQEIFTKVKNHLLTQMERSTKDHTCKYRGPNGLMCAVGCLIPDELYDPEMEGIGLFRLMEDFPEVYGRLNGKENSVLLNSLQTIHDIHREEEWEDKLRDLASDENLEF